MRVFDRKAAPVRVLLLLLGFVLSWGWGWGANPLIDRVYVHPGSGNSNKLWDVLPTSVSICPGEKVRIEGFNFTDGYLGNASSNTCNCSTVTCDEDPGNSPAQRVRVNGAYLTSPNIECWSDNTIIISLPNNSSYGSIFLVEVVVGTGGSAIVSNAAILNAKQPPVVTYPSQAYCPGISVASPSITNPPVTFTYPGGFTGSGSNGSFSINTNVTAGTYNITVTPNAGACAAFTQSSIPIAVTAVVPTSINGSGVCPAIPPTQGYFNYQTVTLVPTPNTPGIWTASPQSGVVVTGLPSNQASLVVSINSTPGIHAITFSPSNGCYSPSIYNLTVHPRVRLNYPSSSICSTDPIILPDSTFTTGTFSIQGMSGPQPGLNSTTGAINPSQIGNGSKTILWKDNNLPCPNEASFTINIIQTPQISSFQYGNNTHEICDYPLNVSPTFNLGGYSGPKSFSATPSTLPIDALTGELQLSQAGFSNFGQFLITLTAGQPGCEVTDTHLVRIVNDTAFLHYANYQICSADPVLAPVGLGPDQNQGSFAAYSASNVLLNQPALNTTTGEINPASITASGSFSVCWEMAGRACRDSICTPTPLTADLTDDPAFGYLPVNPQPGQQVQTVFCLDELPATASANTFGGVFTQISPSNTNHVAGSFFGGSSMPPGMYVIRHSFNPPCPSYADLSIEVLGNDVVNFAYINGLTGTNSFCQGEDYLFPVITSPTPLGGTFSIVGTPPGITVEPATGKLTFNQPNPGTYTIEYLSAGPCPATGTATINILTSPQSDFDLHAFSICEGRDTLGLTAIDDAPAWEIVDVDSAANVLNFLPNSTTILTESAAPGYYRVRHTMGQGGCQSTTEQYFTIIDYDDTTAVEILNPSPTNEYCAGDTLEFLISGSSIGNFNIPGLSSIRISPDSAKVFLAPTLSNSTFDIIYSAYGQCGESQTLSFGVLGKDNTRLEFPQTAYCENEVGIGPTLASPLNGTFTIFSDSNYFQINTTDGKITVIDSLINEEQAIVTYRTVEVCPNEAQEILYFYPKPKAIRVATDPPGEACYGETITLIASASGAQKYQFKHLGGTFLPLASAAIDSFVNLATGLQTFELTAESGRGCRDSIQLPYEVKPIPFYLNPPTFAQTIIHPNAGVIDISTLPALSTTHWEAVTSNYQIENTAQDVAPPDLIYNGTLVSTYSGGEIKFYLQPEARGCFGELDSVTVYVQPTDADIFIPGIFTPNGDGVNDNWEIRSKTGVNTQGYLMKVFTHSGALVASFILDEQISSWSGDEAPDGVYRWMLFDTKRNFVQKGGLTIIRTPKRAQ